MSTMNRLANTKNEYQGKSKRVLCVCSAGLLRSPTAAEVLSREPFNFNTRAAGLNKDFALIVVDSVLLEWADEIVCMQPDQLSALEARTEKPIVCLNIEDSHPFRSPALVKEITARYWALGPAMEKTEAEK